MIVKAHPRFISNVLAQYYAGDSRRFFTSGNSGASNKIRLYRGAVPTAADYINNGASAYSGDLVGTFQGMLVGNSGSICTLTSPLPPSITAALDGPITWASLTYNDTNYYFLLASVGDATQDHPVIINKPDCVSGDTLELVNFYLKLEGAA